MYSESLCYSLHLSVDNLPNFLFWYAANDLVLVLVGAGLYSVMPVCLSPPGDQNHILLKDPIYQPDCNDHEQ